MKDEWTRYVDESEEDDAKFERVERAKRERKQRVIRGNGVKGI